MKDAVLDQFVRQFGTGTRTRRAWLMVLAGAALTEPDLGEAAAGRGKVGARCRKNGECCKGAICTRGKCRCNRKANFADCNGDGRCKRLRNDSRNCGRCGFACPDGACVRGRCRCPDGRPVCFKNATEGICCAADSICVGVEGGEPGEKSCK